MADRALGLAPAADAQLAEPAAGLRATRATTPTASGRCPRSSSSSTATRARSRPRCETRTTVTSVRRTDAGYLVRTDRGDWHGRTVVIATGACNVALRPERRRGRAGGDQDAHAHGIPQPGPARRRRRAGRRRLGDRRPARRRDPPLGPPGDAGRGRARPGAPDLPRPGHPVVDGRRRRARRALRRGRRHRPGARVPSLQLVGSPDRGPARSQRAERASASRSSAGSPASATARRSSRARCATSARSPTSSWAGCSTRSTSGRPRTASTARSSRRTASRRPRSTESPPSSLDLTRGRDQDHHLGDRLPPRLLLARRAGPRSQGPDPPRRRGRRRPACI